MPEAPENEAVRVDMTPMIDVVFLMIIFFVCIDFRVLEARLPAWLPRDQGSRSKLEPAESIEIHVHVKSPGTKTYQDESRARGDGRPARFVLSGHEVVWSIGPAVAPDEGSLVQSLSTLLADNQLWRADPANPTRMIPPQVIITGRNGAYYDDIARTSDIVRDVGFPDIGFGSVW